MTDIEEKIKWLEDIAKISKIENNKVYLRDGTVLNILKIEPINIKLKSLAERNAVFESYKYFLKGCDFNFQIFVQTERTNVEKHIDEIRKSMSCEPEISALAEDYLNLIKNISNVRGSISRKFYIIFKAKLDEEENRVQKVVEGLKPMGNIATQCSNKEIKKIIKECYKVSLEKLYEKVE